MALPNTTLYVPTLAVRASEMNGLEELPALTKDRLRPVFLLAPWGASRSLVKTIERIEKAFPNRPYYLDIDRDYPIQNLENPAQEELQKILDSSSVYANWREFISKHNRILPCLQFHNQSEKALREQINFLQEAGREFCVRIEKSRFPTNVDKLIEVLNEVGTADFTLVIDGGWTNDPLTLSAWFSGVLSGPLNDIDASIPIIISCTSMPKQFSEIIEHEFVAFSNRDLVDQIARQSNRQRVVYGDWGSTRPREPSGFAQRPYDRIDYPTGNGWVIARNKDKDWTFKEAAKEIVSLDEYWDGSLGIWGENMIMQTANNPAFAINTPQKNVAARVNIHLHRQAFFNDPDVHDYDFDEDWED